MINNFIQSLKNSSRQTLLLSMLFMIGALVSTYKLFMLPDDLLYRGNIANVSLATGVFVTLGIVVITTLVLGIVTISIAVQTKKETIVYIEKKKAQEILTNDNTSVTEEKKLDLELFKSKIGSSGEFSLQQALNELCELVQAGQGAVYVTQTIDGKRTLELKVGFALPVAETAAPQFEFGEGLIGQVAASGKSVYLDEVPEGYITIISGLGASYPRYLLILPSFGEEKMKAVVELATFQPMSENMRKQLGEMVNFLASKIN